ncbi:unnamed protein product [Prunus armeniaca]
MQIPGQLESLSNPAGEVVFFTDVFRHGLRLPLRHSVQKVLAAIGYAPGQFNPNFWITLLGTITAGVGAVELPGGKAKGPLCGGGAEFSEDLAPALGSGVRSLGIGTGGSLKRPITMKREIEVIERVRSRISEEGRFHKALLDYKNLYNACLISELEYLRRKEEEEEKERQRREMTDATRRRLQSWAPQKKTGSSRPKTKTPRQAEGASAQEGTPADRLREKRVAEAELIREAHLQVTGKRVIEGALDVTPLSKRPKGPNEEAAVLVPDDDEDTEADPVNIACPRKVVPFVNCFIEGAQMKSLREQAGRAFRLQAAANMEMWLGMKRAVNTAERVQKKYEDGRAKVAEAGKLLQDADRYAEENAAKIAELSSRLAEAERAAVDADEARTRAEAAKEAVLWSRATEVEEAKKQVIAEYRDSPEFVAFLDKEVMVQCEDLIYRLKRFNVDNKLNLNFLREPPPLPERVTEEMVEAYLGEDAEVETSSGSESDSEEEEATPLLEPSSVRDTEVLAPPAAEDDHPTP